MARVLIIAMMLLAGTHGASAQSNHGPDYPTNQHTPAYPTNQHTSAYPKSRNGPVNSVPAPRERNPAPTYYLTLIFGNRHAFPQTAIVQSPQSQCSTWESTDTTRKLFRCVQLSPFKPQLFDSFSACKAAGQGFRAPAADPQRIISSFKCRKSS